MKKVLILAYECAPYHRLGSTIGAQRPAQFAKYLPKSDWTAIVVCSDFKKRYSLHRNNNWKTDIESTVNNALKTWDKSQSIIIPLPSLSGADYLDSIWMNAVIWNEQDGTFTPRPGLLNFLKRKFATFIKLFSGDHSQSWQAVAHCAASKLIASVKIDFVLAEHGPDAGIFVAKKLNKEYQIPWGVDFRDPILLPVKKFARSWVRLYYKYILLRSSQFTCNVNPYWAELDRKELGTASNVITNGFDPEEFSNLSRKRNAISGLILFYGGNIKPVYQSFDLLFEALKIIELKGIQVKFNYLGSAYKKVDELAQTYQLQDVVLSKSQMNRFEYFDNASNADLMIVLSIQDAKEVYFKKGFYPGKVFDYFGLGKPIINIPGDDGLLDQLLEETQAGLTFSDAEKLATHLTRLALLKLSGEPIPYYPSTAVNRYTRENQTSVLGNLLNSTLNQLEVISR